MLLDLETASALSVKSARGRVHPHKLNAPHDAAAVLTVTLGGLWSCQCQGAGFISLSAARASLAALVDVDSPSAPRKASGTTRA